MTAPHLRRPLPRASRMASSGPSSVQGTLTDASIHQFRPHSPTFTNIIRGIARIRIPQVLQARGAAENRSPRNRPPSKCRRSSNASRPSEETSFALSLPPAASPHFGPSPTRAPPRLLALSVVSCHSLESGSWRQRGRPAGGCRGRVPARTPLPLPLTVLSTTRGQLFPDSRPNRGKDGRATLRLLERAKFVGSIYFREILRSNSISLAHLRSSVLRFRCISGRVSPPSLGSRSTNKKGPGPFAV